MSIQYTVGNRAARPFARWGFTLPPTPTAGPRPPLYLPAGGQGLAEAMMDEVIVGSYVSTGVVSPRVEGSRSIYRMATLPASTQGLWTGGISDCMVVCAAYYDRAHSAWGRIWFEHVQGGLYEDILGSIEYDITEDGEAPNAGDRYAVLAAGNDAGTATIATKLSTIGIPSNNISIYVSGTGNRGFAFAVNFATGLFGETTHQGATLPDNWQW